MASSWVDARFTCAETTAPCSETRCPTPTTSSRRCSFATVSAVGPVGIAAGGSDACSRGPRGDVTTWVAARPTTADSLAAPRSAQTRTLVARVGAVQPAEPGAVLAIRWLVAGARGAVPRASERAEALLCSERAPLKLQPVAVVVVGRSGGGARVAAPAAVPAFTLHGAAAIRTEQARVGTVGLHGGLRGRAARRGTSSARGPRATGASCGPGCVAADRAVATVGDGGRRSPAVTSSRGRRRDSGGSRGFAAERFEVEGACCEQHGRTADGGESSRVQSQNQPPPPKQVHSTSP